MTGCWPGKLYVLRSVCIIIAVKSQNPGKTYCVSKKWSHCKIQFLCISIGFREKEPTTRTAGMKCTACWIGLKIEFRPCSTDVNVPSFITTDEHLHANLDCLLNICYGITFLRFGYLSRKDNVYWFYHCHWFRLQNGSVEPRFEPAKQEVAKLVRRYRQNR